MASIASSCRLSARAAARQVRSHANSRAFRTSSAALAAHNFTMPALSPTMTEGSIASWKVKEGDSFSAGDVLLEVETDKAQMDVEAQDDGVMFKITVGDGSKAVAVGTRIGVLADPDDDLSTLEIPSENTPKKAESSKPSSPPEPASKPSPEAAKSSPPAEKPKGAGSPQKYPLYPSVQMLLHQYHLKAEDIPSSGPSGRLLKGDVLAYLNQIPSSYPSEVSSRITKLSHLDLSNIKPAAPKAGPSKDAKPAAAALEKVPEPPVSLAVPVSLTAVLEVQKRMQQTLGITLPLSTFVARAIALANEDLPFSRKTPTADELFDAIVGVDKLKAGAKQATRDGAFAPQIVAIPDRSATAGLAFAPKPAAGKRKGGADLFDDIVGKTGVKSVQAVRRPAAIGAVGPENIFSLSVEREEEKRAKVFLERVKSVLEVDPGRLVL